MCSIIVDDVGQQTDNSQRTENDFPCVHLFTSSTVREIFDGLDDEINHSADGLKDRAECNHAQHLLSSVRIEQLASHLMEQCQIIQHFLDFFLGAAVIK